MKIDQLYYGTLYQEPELMRKIVLANENTLNDCYNEIKRCKAIINFHTSTYVYGQNELYNPTELTAALIDMNSACQMIINKLNEIK